MVAVKQRILNLDPMILDKLSNKLDPKKNIHRSTWKKEIDKNHLTKLGARVLGEEEEEERRGWGRGT